MNITTKSYSNMSHGRRIIGIAGMVIAGVVFAVVFAFLFGYIVQLIWNWLMPELFGFKIISYWQAFALVVLAKLLFGGFGQHHHDRHSVRDRRVKHGFPDWEPFADDRIDRDTFRKYWKSEGEKSFKEYLERQGTDK